MIFLRCFLYFFIDSVPPTGYGVVQDLSFSLLAQGTRHKEEEEEHWEEQEGEQESWLEHLTLNTDNMSQDLEREDIL